jgi:hypothetical protein
METDKIAILNGTIEGGFGNYLLLFDEKMIQKQYFEKLSGINTAGQLLLFDENL